MVFTEELIRMRKQSYLGIIAIIVLIIQVMALVKIVECKRLSSHLKPKASLDEEESTKMKCCKKMCYYQCQKCGMIADPKTTECYEVCILTCFYGKYRCPPV